MARGDGDGPQTSVSSQFIEIRSDLQGINSSVMTSLKKKKAFVTLQQMLLKQMSLPSFQPLVSFELTLFMVLIARSVLTPVLDRKSNVMT